MGIDRNAILQHIESKYTAVELVKALKLSVSDLCVLLESEIVENADLFEHEMLGIK